MFYNIHYDIFALVILAILSCLYLTRRNAPTKRNKTFKALLVGAYVSTCADLFTGIVYSLPYRFSILTANISTVVYFISINAMPLLFFFFAKAVADKQEEKTSISVITLFFFLYFVGVLLIIMSPLKHFIFEIDAHGNYTRCNGLIYLYLISAIYLLSGVGVLVKSRKEIPTQKLITTFLFVILITISIVIQLFRPRDLVESFFIAISLLLIYFYIQKPEDLIDNITSLFNQSAFLLMADKEIKDNKLYAVGLTIEDLNFLNSTFSVKSVNSILRDVANYLYILTKNAKNINVYHLNQGRFCITYKAQNTLSNEENTEILLRYTDTIISRFNDAWKNRDSVDINLFCRVVFVKPDEIQKADDMIDIIDTLSIDENIKNNMITDAPKIDIDRKKRFIKLDSLIKTCLKNNLLSVFYQPIYATAKNRVIGAEAVIRMQDENGIYISPEEFIPIAEKNGCVTRIGEFVFDNVCQMLRSINPKEYGIEKIDVNLSVIQCMQKSLSDLILTIAYSYQIPLRLINLEITETAAARFPEILKQNMQRLSESGIELSLDDYGSGYANMNYLLSLPFKMIKIDKEIVWTAFKNPKASIALEATIAMIKALDMTVLAEGVETEEQKEWLIDLGCDYLQGYYFSKPIPKSDFLDYLKEEIRKNPKEYADLTEELELLPPVNDGIEELEAID